MNDKKSVFKPEFERRSRCSWVSQDPLYIHYHDSEWGIPQYDSKTLFEKICLEGQQAGLSWITVLKKRDGYRQCFHNFDPEKIAVMTEQEIDELVKNVGLIRHRGKLDAIVNNAKAYMKMLNSGEDFSAFIWSFVGGSPKINYYKTAAELPSQDEKSNAMANALKKRGFKFVGSTICYAFMQSMGLINDHTADCYLHPNNR